MEHVGCCWLETGWTHALLIRLMPLCTSLASTRRFWGFVCGFVAGEAWRRCWWLRRRQNHPSLHPQAAGLLDLPHHGLLLCLRKGRGSSTHRPFFSSSVLHWNCRWLVLRTCARSWSAFYNHSVSSKNRGLLSSYSLHNKGSITLSLSSWFCVCPALVSSNVSCASISMPRKINKRSKYSSVCNTFFFIMSLRLFLIILISKTLLL